MGSNVLTSKGALGKDVLSLKGGRGALIKAPVGLHDLNERMNRSANRERPRVGESSLKRESIEGRRYLEGLRFQPNRGNPAVRDCDPKNNGKKIVFHLTPPSRNVNKIVLPLKPHRTFTKSNYPKVHEFIAGCRSDDHQ